MVYSIVVEVVSILNLCKLISNITFICYFFTFSEVIHPLIFHSKRLTSIDQPFYILLIPHSNFPDFATLLIYEVKHVCSQF